VRSQIENYRAKAKKFARLAAVAKSLRHSRQCQKLAEMYWALALGEEPERAPPSKTNVNLLDATFPFLLQTSVKLYGIRGHFSAHRPMNGPFFSPPKNNGLIIVSVVTVSVTSSRDYPIIARRTAMLTVTVALLAIGH